MSNPDGRHELKHYINRFDMLQLRARLPCVMSRDKNSDENGGYRIRSLYFDNYNDKALLEKINGVDIREKFRLRFYRDDPSFIRLEKKCKKNGLCYKYSANISYEVCTAILNGDFDALRETGIPLHTELYAKMRYELLRPKNIVDYRRDAFIFTAGDVRVTLDYDIHASMNTKDFLKHQCLTVPIPETFILEVKYSNYLPELIRGLVMLPGRQATAFSKYAIARSH